MEPDEPEPQPVAEPSPSPGSAEQLELHAAVRKLREEGEATMGVKKMVSELKRLRPDWGGLVNAKAVRETGKLWVDEALAGGASLAHRLAHPPEAAAEGADHVLADGVPFACPAVCLGKDLEKWKGLWVGGASPPIF